MKFDDQAAFASQHDGRYDATLGHWVGDTAELSSDDLDDFPPKRLRERHTKHQRQRLLPVDDDTDGDESKRERTFTVYIFRGHVARQVIGRAGTLNKPKKNLVPHMLSVLKTVEFINP